MKKSLLIQLIVAYAALLVVIEVGISFVIKFLESDAFQLQVSMIIILLLIIFIELIIFIVYTHKQLKRSLSQKPMQKPIKQIKPEAHPLKYVKRSIDLHSLVYYIERQLQKGYKKQEVNSKLRQVGWLQEDINKAFSLVKDNQQLRQYIQNELNLGFVKPKIKQRLLEQGWTEEEIDRYL